MAEMNLAPIVLFVYKRYWHTQQTIQSLLRNKLSADSELHIFSDGPKNEKDYNLVQKVREYINALNGFSKVFVYESERNFGLASSVINGVTKILERYEKVIVLEDDLILSEFFLEYMNKALDLYKDEEKVISIHGYIYPVKAKLPETFFLKGADCWGWATWKRGWSLFEYDSIKLLNEIYKNELEKEFDWNGAANYIKMLKKQAKGKIDSWAIRWHASAFLKKRFTLYPGRSLVKNIGMDEFSTHTKKTKIYNVDLTTEPILLNRIPVEEHEEVKNEIQKYFGSIKGNYLQKLLRFSRKDNR